MIEEKIKDSEPVKSLKNKTRDLLLILIIIRIWERILCSSASLLFQSFVFVFLCLWWHCFEFWLLGEQMQEEEEVSLCALSESVNGVFRNFAADF